MTTPASSSSSSMLGSPGTPGPTPAPGPVTRSHTHRFLLFFKLRNKLYFPVIQCSIAGCPSTLASTACIPPFLSLWPPWLIPTGGAGAAVGGVGVVGAAVVGTEVGDKILSYSPIPGPTTVAWAWVTSPPCHLPAFRYSFIQTIPNHFLISISGNKLLKYKTASPGAVAGLLLLLDVPPRPPLLPLDLLRPQLWRGQPVHGHGSHGPQLPSLARLHLSGTRHHR